MSPIAIIVPDDALLADVAESAAGQHLHILSNGRRTVLSPVLVDGWTEIRVRSRPAGAEVFRQEAR